MHSEPTRETNAAGSRPGNVKGNYSLRLPYLALDSLSHPASLQISPLPQYDKAYDKSPQPCSAVLARSLHSPHIQLGRRRLMALQNVGVHGKPAIVNYRSSTVGTQWMPNTQNGSRMHWRPHTKPSQPQSCQHPFLWLRATEIMRALFRCRPLPSLRPDSVTSLFNHVVLRVLRPCFKAALCVPCGL